MRNSSLVLYDALYETIGVSDYTNLLFDMAQLHAPAGKITLAVPGVPGYLGRAKVSLPRKFLAIIHNTRSLRVLNPDKLIMNVWDYNFAELLEIALFRCFTRARVICVVHDQRSIHHDRPIPRWNKSFVHALSEKVAFISSTSFNALEPELKSKLNKESYFVFDSPLSPRPNLNKSGHRSGTIFFGNFGKKVKFSERQKEKIEKLATIDQFAPVTIAGSGASSRFGESSTLRIIDRFIPNDELNEMLARSKYGLFLYKEIYNSFVWSDCVYGGLIPVTDSVTSYTENLVKSEYAIDLDKVLNQGGVDSFTEQNIQRNISHLKELNDVVTFFRDFVLA